MKVTPGSWDERRGKMSSKQRLLIEEIHYWIEQKREGTFFVQTMESRVIMTQHLKQSMWCWMCWSRRHNRWIEGRMHFTLKSLSLSLSWKVKRMTSVSKHPEHNIHEEYDSWKDWQHTFSVTKALGRSSSTLEAPKSGTAGASTLTL
jgi:hypothetical protein